MTNLVVHIRYSSLRKAWLIVFLLGLLGNAWLVTQTAQTLTDHYVGLRQELHGFIHHRHHYHYNNKTTLSIIKYHQQQLQQQQQQQQRQDQKGKQPEDSPFLHPVKAMAQNRTRDFSICLLIKDDNQLLNEWIAYHYHVLTLRYLVVATDPESKTSPAAILQLWRMTFPDLHIDEWTDDNYMPEFFLRGMYDYVPRMIKWGDNATKWQADASEEQLKRTFQHINNHRYRQSKFLQACAKHLKAQQKTWMTHIDTDEFVTINPTLREMGTAGNITVPTILGNDTVSTFLQDLTDLNARVVNWPCISMPRIFFGSYQIPHDDISYNGTIPSFFNVHRFETLLWRYHANFFNAPLNKSPKIIMDVSGFPDSQLNTTKQKVFSIHRPSILLCRKQGQMNVQDGRKYPLVVHHYLGTLERYQSRDDPRRTVGTYSKKANVQEGKHDGWISHWLPSFVDTYGMDRVGKVLKDYSRHPVSSSSSLVEKEVVDDTEKHKYDGLGRSWSVRQDNLSACLFLQKDHHHNDILSEWIAYHYHVLKLRTLIVAIDPTNTVTSPMTILNKFRTKLGMTIEEWTDRDYMPEFYPKGNSSAVIDMEESENIDGVREGMETRLHNHRFRRATFWGSCARELRNRGKTWMISLDANEFIVFHPQIRRQRSWRRMSISTEVEPNVIFSFLKQGLENFSKALNYPCLAMPQVVFGFMEDDKERDSSIPTGFDVSKFATIRWKYYNQHNLSMNGTPKIMMDLTGLPPATFLRDHAYEIHHLALQACGGREVVNFDEKWKFPLTVNHYSGSWPRYNQRNPKVKSRPFFWLSRLLSCRCKLNLSNLFFSRTTTSRET